MLLQRLNLHNIRSYLDETIEFPEGSILLAGDIGAGKSTILLAIEFALFGASKSELPAESLLRKGASQGSVECSFSLEGKEITIKRGLKRERDTVRQTAGHIIINDIKRELMPTELKAEVISLLGYPEDTAAKDKNYLFRYTIYTPQEEMRRILEDDPEERLDSLRRIFNVDKYKTIRENLQVYLKGMRMQIAILKTKTEPWEEESNKLREIRRRQEEMGESLRQSRNLLQALQERVQQQQKEVAQLEEQQRRYKMTAALREEKKRQISLLELRLEEIAGFPLPENIDKVRRKIEEVETQRSHQARLEEKERQLRERIDEARQFLERAGREVRDIPEKEGMLKMLEEEIQRKEQVPPATVQRSLQQSFYEVSSLIARNQTLVQQSRELIWKIRKLDTCPTCLQAVSEQHKQAIVREEERKTAAATTVLTGLAEKKDGLARQLQELEREMKAMLEKEMRAAQLRLELRHLREKQREIEEREGRQNDAVREHQEIFLQLQRIRPEDVGELRKQLDVFARKQLLEEQRAQCREELQKLHAEEIAEVADWLVAEKKGLFAEAQQVEKEQAVKLAELQTRMGEFTIREQELQSVVDTLVTLREKLAALKKTYHWLEEHFLNLTYTIEKQVMLNIHRLFTELFQEWFSILLEDDSVAARIDDSFCPQIEQNGYDLSFSFLSGGERTSAALAYRLALNRVINDIIHAIKTKDLLILDEPTDGFSSEQLDKVRDVLDRLHLRQTIIVSHEAKIETFVEKVIRVEKEGHVSRVT